MVDGRSEFYRQLDGGEIVCRICGRTLTNIASIVYRVQIDGVYVHCCISCLDEDIRQYRAGDETAVKVHAILEAAHPSKPKKEK